MIIVIDGTNIGGEGGVTHLKEILNSYNLSRDIIVIAQKKILVQLPERSFLTKISHCLLEKTLVHRIYFQFFIIDRMIPKDAILYSITGDFLGNHKPIVSMSQNMLLYERYFWKKIRQFKEIFKLWINYHKQKHSFENSEGIIFISNYAKNYISKIVNFKYKKTIVIHHGISSRFFKEVQPQKHISEYSWLNPFKFTYISTVHVYKNQCNVVKVIGRLREKGYPVELILIGRVIFNPAGKCLEKTIRKIDPRNQFIHKYGNITYEEIDKLYKSTTGILFASTCENMPNILIESMASGVPIASSIKQPMPEFLKEYGFYFDANNIDSIEASLIEFLESPQKREINAKNAQIEVSKYSWNETSKKTFEFLIDIYEHYQKH